jgi:hypothetical protein
MPLLRGSTGLPLPAEFANLEAADAEEDIAAAVAAASVENDEHDGRFRVAARFPKRAQVANLPGTQQKAVQPLLQCWVQAMSPLLQLLKPRRRTMWTTSCWPPPWRRLSRTSSSRPAGRPGAGTPCSRCSCGGCSSR